MSWTNRVPILKPFELHVMKAKENRIEIIIAGAVKTYFVWYSKNKHGWVHYIHYLNCNRYESQSITDKQRINICNHIRNEVFRGIEVNSEMAHIYKSRQSKKKFKNLTSRFANDENDGDGQDEVECGVEGNPNDYGDKD